MKKVLRRILNIVIDVVVVIILALSVIIITLSFTTKSAGVPNVLGYAPLSVQTGSMEHTFDPGDLIICKMTNDPSVEYKKGDVVTFPIEIDGKATYNTHRIVDVVKDNDITYYKTQGDNKKTNSEPDEDLQTSSTILAQYTGNKISGLGYVLSFMRTQLGFFLCILLPMIAFFIYEAIRVVLNIIAYNKEKAMLAAKDAVENSELTEEQKQRAINEYLASVQGDKKNNDDLGQTPPEESDKSENKNSK